MAWIEISFAVDSDGAERLSPILEELGALAVTLRSGGNEAVFDQVDESPTLWRQTRLTALFDADAETDFIILQVTDALDPLPLPPCEVAHLDDQDWNRLWMDRFQPLRFGRRLWVVPSWHEPPDPSAVNLRLDPGMAFGTGTHPTTAMCLRWLERAELRGRVVIDYGCGSGILAIAALKLGAARAYAVDVDPQCLITTRENAGRNDIGDELWTGPPDQLPVEIGADALLANILAGPLVQLVPVFAGLLKPDGDLVLSGLLSDQVNDCLAAYRTSFNMNPPHVEGDWAMLTGRRR
ncbi:MAG TPA: 50S ribosomal protein L11 methyltransferase [Gammaproteobacteria bacterium]|nr:50S ribosomal protein L11 methyltransferase [Gammaproteobacteria bacterium]